MISYKQIPNADTKVLYSELAVLIPKLKEKEAELAVVYNAYQSDYSKRDEYRKEYNEFGRLDKKVMAIKKEIYQRENGYSLDALYKKKARLKVEREDARRELARARVAYGRIESDIVHAEWKMREEIERRNWGG